MKRSRQIPTETEFSQKKSCHDCTELKTYIDNMFKQQTEILKEQNKKIMEALAAQNVLTKILVKQDETSNMLSNLFPINSEKNLNEIENQINENNKHLYVTTIKNLIRKNIVKNIGLIISEELLYTYNVDGTHGKKRLKNFENIYNAIKDAVGANPEIDDIEGRIRRALNLTKKRHLKKF
ncbi:uncharacterized protein LOC119613285 [Lucilia sericata]|uniref:uncharacterized protein LOC119613285 n=2 Tax=Lucilia sericata TaxID=13632 RepID=UPI0018A87410|nr:uncharacterized protein LOC119613285 [Lucilia sericata]